MAVWQEQRRGRVGERVARRRRMLRQRRDALINAVLVIVGGQILLLGAALELNVLSMRKAVEDQQLGRAVTPIFTFRAQLSHYRAQQLELLLALLGAALIATGVTRELLAWYRLTRQR